MEQPHELRIKPEHLEHSYMRIYTRPYSLDRKKWQYRGEGNANLVLSLTKERKIVRFRKDEVTSVMGRKKALFEVQQQERVYLESVFSLGVMGPLLGACYVTPGQAGYIATPELGRLDRMLRFQRPVHRHNKGLRYGHVMVYPDYALLPFDLSPLVEKPMFFRPMFCIEVKPKQGWLPRVDRRQNKCTYCLNQYYKLKNGRIRRRSKYCPLDLFSGDRIRMKRAIYALFDDPQNNLKLFQDGVLIYGEEVRGDLGCITRIWFPDGAFNKERLMDKLVELILDGLSHSLANGKLPPVRWNLSNKEPFNVFAVDSSSCLPGNLLIQVDSCVMGTPCDWTAVDLPPDSILQRILAVQRLEVSGSDRVYHAYRQESLISDYHYVHLLLMAKEFGIMDRYLLATTAKDCSVMMTFQRLSLASDAPERHVVCDVDQVPYVMNIGVSDLDPKPLSCIEKHRRRDVEMLTAVLEVVEVEEAEEERQAVIARALAAKIALAEKIAQAERDAIAAREAAAAAKAEAEARAREEARALREARAASEALAKSIALAASKARAEMLARAAEMEARAEMEAQAETETRAISAASEGETSAEGESGAENDSGAESGVNAKSKIPTTQL